MDRQRILIDTSLLIDHLRRQNKERTVFYRAVQRYECAVSAITEFEFRTGSTPANRDFVVALLDLTPVLPFDSACVHAAVDIYRNLRSSNQLIALPDLFIAATAVAHDLPLLTLNLSHFERINRLKVLDPISL
jgi:predicted nucleic acid-binding protein